MKTLRHNTYGDVDVSECFILNRIWQYVTAFDFKIPKEEHKVVNISYRGMMNPIAVPILQKDWFTATIDVVGTSMVKRLVEPSMHNYMLTGPNGDKVDWTFRIYKQYTTIVIHLRSLRMKGRKDGCVYHLDCTFDWYDIEFEDTESPALSVEDANNFKSFGLRC